ncbi:MAG TPA: YihA family ribosome biogenesis GTP-binding protein, partial [Peptostreptococcaceae bacterium]|nr:YihA family ribosome biogenesis GTP-binding protein [Peptostreptococcaceae bacterium]
ISRGQYQKHFSIIRKKLGLKDEKIFPISALKKTGVEELWQEIITKYQHRGYEITVD